MTEILKKHFLAYVEGHSLSSKDVQSFALFRKNVFGSQISFQKGLGRDSFVIKHKIMYL